MREKETKNDGEIQRKRDNKHEKIQENLKEREMGGAEKQREDEKKVLQREK